MDNVNPEELRSLLSTAHADQWVGDELKGKSIANVFFEDSTRTRVSFSIAAQALGASVVDLTSAGSSMAKGETLLDTIWTIESMGVDAIVVRSKQSGAGALIEEHTTIPIINAGDGSHQHPTQALTDALTIGRSFDKTDGWDFSGMRVAIVGDVVSSRVARSNVAALTALGADVVLVGPSTMAPTAMARLGTRGCQVSEDLDSIISSCDAVMMLRIQFERGGGALLASTREYHHKYGMNQRRLDAMKPNAIVMHPGPMNRGVEIVGSIADSDRARILDQVNGGVLVRKAALNHAINHAINH